ncbi:MAG: GGDEF domain-containing protein, partial [Bacteroidetes bacterium]
SRILQSALRGADTACRFGGEEFCLIMPDTNTGEAHAVCERIREAVRGTIWPAHPERQVTISVGLVGTDGTCWKSPAAWLEAADRNLYRAKKEGRDRVVSSDLSGGDLSERDLSKAA